MYAILVGEPERRSQLGSYRRKFDSNITIYLKEIEHVTGLDWIQSEGFSGNEPLNEVVTNLQLS